MFAKLSEFVGAYSNLKPNSITLSSLRPALVATSSRAGLLATKFHYAIQLAD